MTCVMHSGLIAALECIAVILDITKYLNRQLCTHPVLRPVGYASRLKTWSILVVVAWRFSTDLKTTALELEIPLYSDVEIYVYNNYNNCPHAESLESGCRIVSWIVKFLALSS